MPVAVGLSVLLGGGKKNHYFWPLHKVLIHLPTGRMTRFLEGKCYIFFIAFHFLKAYMNIREYIKNE